MARIRCGREKFREVMSLFTSKVFSLHTGVLFPMVVKPVVVKLVVVKPVVVKPVVVKPVVVKPVVVKPGHWKKRTWRSWGEMIWWWYRGCVMWLWTSKMVKKYIYLLKIAAYTFERLIQLCFSIIGAVDTSINSFKQLSIWKFVFLNI